MFILFFHFAHNCTHSAGTNNGRKYILHSTFFYSSFSISEVLNTVHTINIPSKVMVEVLNAIYIINVPSKLRA